MASVTQMATIFFAGALCLLSLPSLTHSAPQFIVEGEVYCEVCRTNFINRLSEPMAGCYYYYYYDDQISYKSHLVISSNM